MARIFILLVAVLLQAFPAKAQEETPTTEKADSTEYKERGMVLLAGDTLFFLYGELDGISAHERAVLVNTRLSNIVHSGSFEADSFKAIDYVDYSRIFYRGQLVTNLTNADAQWNGKPLPTIAKQYVEVLQTHTEDYRSGFDLKEIIREVVLALVILVISGVIIRYVNRFFKFLARRLELAKGDQIKALVIKNYEVMDENRLVSFIHIVLNVFRILFLLFIFYLTLPVVLRIFPWTKGVADMLFGFILNPLKSILKALVDYIPNLFTIAIIFIVIRYLSKGISYLANEIRTEKLKIAGFYPDWAVPTSRIFNFMLYAFMLVLIWPYLPGSGSPIFQGVSVFLGLLISLGSSSAISNIVAGLVITYMRPFQIGDRVRVGDVSGDVVAKNLLVTRVKTIKNEFITVPNSQVLSNSSINYSTSINESAGLIVHTSVTIGYDAPWRKVHEMLIEAAAKTPLIEEVPAPFVLQTALDDFYIRYQINAYTKVPAKQAVIYSDLHALIQDVFAKNGVEIMSPHYRAVREGPDTTPPPNGHSTKNTSNPSQKSSTDEGSSH